MIYLRLAYSLAGVLFVFCLFGLLFVCLLCIVVAFGLVCLWLLWLLVLGVVFVWVVVVWFAGLVIEQILRICGWCGGSVGVDLRLWHCCLCWLVALVNRLVNF